jgi:predicted outer membrane repeat protein
VKIYPIRVFLLRLPFTTFTSEISYTQYPLTNRFFNQIILLVMGKSFVHTLLTVLLFFLLLSMLSITKVNGAIRYVKPVATGTGDGSSWANASSDLQAMINASAVNDEVWVAAGTYKPVKSAVTGAFNPANRDNAFVLRQGVKIYGGFAGTETLLSQRNLAINTSILSGDIGIANNYFDNCYHVVVSAGHSVSPVLDGFHIQFANSNGGGTVGINGSPTNQSNGAGMFIVESNPIIANCVFSGNTSSKNGAAVCNHDAASTFINCVFSGNLSVDEGAAIHFDGSSSSTLHNCTMAGNRSTNNLGIIANSGTASLPVMRNSIMFGNFSMPAIYGNTITVTNSLLQAAYSGSGNTFNIDPLFVQFPGTAPSILGDCRLQSCSPVIDAGDQSLIPPGVTIDFQSNARVFGNNVDLGAHEFTVSAPFAIPDASGIVYVDHTKSGDGSSWANAVAELSDALMATKNNSSIQQIWVAAGTYKPKYAVGGANCNDPASRYNAFVLKNGVAIYGGFAGTEILLSQRNWESNITILSGDIGVVNVNTDNCYRVVICAGTGTPAVLDGVHIKHGYASGGLPVFVNGEPILPFGGAGLSIHNASPVIRNCTIIQNQTFDYGAGVLIERNALPQISNCIISGGTSSGHGSAICSHFSSPSFINCLVSGNQSTGSTGSTFHCNGTGSPQIINCTMAGNKNSTSTGVIHNNSATHGPTIINSVLYGNEAAAGVTGFVAAASNCISQGGGLTGTNITTANPSFIAPEPASAAPTLAGNYRVEKCSHAINAGTNAPYPPAITTDLDEAPRIYNSTIDIGAYEYQATVVTVVPGAGGVVYVNKNVAVPGNGSSWANALPELGDALFAARTNTAIQQIWVAAGTYYPLYDAVDFSCNPADTRDKTFLLVNNVKVYGGFAGGETLLSQRNWNTHVCVLNGDIGIANDNTDNTYHVVISSGSTGTAELSGFTITGGNANLNVAGGPSINGNTIQRRLGGGIMCYSSSPAINNCIITGNAAILNGGGFYLGVIAAAATVANCTISNNTCPSGAGLYATSTSAAVTFNNCSFTGNTATSSGGGIYANTTILRFNNCILSGNAGSSGAGMYMLACTDIRISNCLVTGNLSSSTGGGMWSSQSSPVITNCTFAGNRATTNGGGLYFTLTVATAPTVYNSIIYGNEVAAAVNNIVTNTGATAPTVYYSIVENASGYTNGGNNNTANPLFINPLDADAAPSTGGTYRLQQCSPAVNSGFNTYTTNAGITVDLDNSTRIQNTTVDRGSYEITVSLPVPDAGGIVFVNKNVAVPGNGSSWANATAELADALKAAKTNTAIQQIWVAAGTYYPLYDAVSLVCGPADNRDKTFLLVNNVKVYGGFAGSETLLSQRNWNTNVCELNGDIGTANDNTDNAYHVVVSAGAVGTAALDGFTVTNGNANVNSTVTVNAQTVSRRIGGGIFCYNSAPLVANCSVTNNASNFNGGGIYLAVISSSTSFTNCTISNNTCPSGAGLYATSISAAVTFNNCSFTGNTATSSGGGIYANTTILRFNNCILSGNAGSSGAGMYMLACTDIRISNCLVTGNLSSSTGGGIWSSQSSPVITNCTFAGNRATTTGGGLYFTLTVATAPTVYNSIIYGNEVAAAVNNIVTNTGATAPTVYYSIVENAAGYTNGGNNSTANPLFINPQDASLAPTADGNYRVQKCSPAINGGLNTYTTNASITTDLDNNSRFSFTTVDRGVYEKALAVPNTNGIVYVDKSNTDNEGDGSSWERAVTELADALKAAKTNTAIQQIWTANGTYYPLYDATDNGSLLSCPSVNMNNSFVMVNNVKVYGGFAGGETDTTARNFAVNETILNGDIDNNNDSSGNAYHVLISAGEVGSAELDGFTVTKGNALNASSTTYVSVNSNLIYINHGGGMYNKGSSPLVKQCRFINNYSFRGGGIYNAIGTSPLITHCEFSGNKAINEGGGIYNIANSTIIRFCDIKGNFAYYGAGLYNIGSNSQIINCVFTGNTSHLQGGAIHIQFTPSPSIINCTIAGNNTLSFIGAGGIQNEFSNPLIYNCIVWGNRENGTIVSNITNFSGTASATYSLIEGGYAGTGNINADPLFVNPQSAVATPTVLGDYHLQACSPAINVGNNADVPGGITTDLDNNPRIMFTDVDMGAYEVQAVDFTATTWRGYNTNWHDKINWCGGYIPSSSTNATIPSSLSNYPTLSSAGTVKDFTLNNGTSIATATTGSLAIYGNYANNGSTITNNGSWIMAGSAAGQTFPGTNGTAAAMHNLEINNNNGISLDKSFEITGTLTPTNGDINVSNNVTVTLHSDAVATARVAALQSNASISYTGTGKFAVERYIPARRSWRLLTAPVSAVSGLTISQAWQEGLSNTNRLAPVNTYPGFGTTITKSTVYNPLDGYDHGSTNNPSIRYYNGINWGGVPSATNGTTPGANNGLINDQQGYMLFARGDRGIQVAGTNVIPTNTTLRPAGQLKSGPQIINCNGWTVIGNPYASSINFHTIALDNPGLPDQFYLWEADLTGSNGVGGWVSYGAYDNLLQTYTVTPLLPESSTATNTGDIPSGAAFMVNYTGSIIINENCKSTGNNNALFRPAKQLAVNLLAVNADSSVSLNDGVAVLFSAGTEAASQTIAKNNNFTECISINKSGNNLAIQKRQPLQEHDTVFLHLSQMQRKQYQLEFIPAEVKLPSACAAFLKDDHLHHTELLDTDNKSRYPFTITNDSSSYAANRFSILIKKAVVVTSISAMPAGGNVVVSWQVAAEYGMLRYEIERSSNGTDFSHIGTLGSNGYSPSILQYTWTDVQPTPGNYYYRVKCINQKGIAVYSDTVQAELVNAAPGMYVYPNPVRDRRLQLRMNKIEKGECTVKLIAADGQVIFTSQWTHNGNDGSRIFNLPVLANGIYQLQVHAIKEPVHTFSVLLQQ